jgi:hypothetical protein
MRIGRIGPFSLDAHLRSVCGCLLIAAAASLVDSTSGKLFQVVKNCWVIIHLDCSLATGETAVAEVPINPRQRPYSPQHGAVCIGVDRFVA